MWLALRSTRRVLFRLRLFWTVKTPARPCWSREVALARTNSGGGYLTFFDLSWIHNPFRFSAYFSVATLFPYLSFTKWEFLTIMKAERYWEKTQKISS